VLCALEQPKVDNSRAKNEAQLGAIGPIGLRPALGPTSFPAQHLTFYRPIKWLITTSTGKVIYCTFMLNVLRHLGILRKLKYRLSRQNLEKLYLIYIRPIFEYACEKWDNCGVCYSTKLEKLQLDAARIVTGLPIFTKQINCTQKQDGLLSLVEVIIGNSSYFIT
jgi:hypothetical protein